MIKDPISPSSAPLASPPGAAKPPRASGSGSNLKACPFPGCDAAFAKPAHLQRHQLVHDKEQPHACQYCDQKFGRLDSLKRHQGRKHAEHGSPSGDNSTSAGASLTPSSVSASHSTGVLAGNAEGDGTPNNSGPTPTSNKRRRTQASQSSRSVASSSNDASQASPHGSATVPWPSRGAFAQPLGDHPTPPRSPASPSDAFRHSHAHSKQSVGANEAWSEALGATPASSSTNTSAVPPWSDLERAAQLHDQDIGGVAGNSLAALASVAQSQLPVGAMSAASAMLGNAAEAGSGASSALPFHLNSSTWSTSSPSFMPDPANEAMMPSIDDILESFLASSAATSFSGSGSGFFLDGANDIFPAQSAQPFAPSLSDHAVPTPGTSVAAHTATPPSAPSPASHSLQTSCSPFVRAAASSLGTPRMPFPSSPSIPQHSAHRSSDPHHNSRQGSESAAAEKVASETRDLVIKGVVLPRLPQAASAEEIFWLANSRLPTLAPVIPPAFMQQGVQAKTFPVLYIIVSALGTLWHSDPSVREYGLSLWYFTYLAMWTQSGFLIDDSQATAYGLVVALHAQLFAKLSGEKFAGFRKARLGYNTLRATSRERGWRQLDAPFRLAIFAALDSPDQLRFAHDVLQDQRASFEARASALRAAEAAWAAWQEREQATRTAIVMAIMDGQNTPYDASLQPDGSNGIEAFDLGASSVNILLQAVLPTFNIEAWAAKTSMEWLKAILAPSANAFEQSSLQSGGLHSLQVGQIVDEMLNGQEEVTLAVFEKRHTALLELAVLEGLHFAWLGRKHSDGGWVRSMTRAFHPNETAAKAHPTMPWASPNHSSGTSLQDQVHAALARWPSLPFTDVFSSAQTRNSTVDGTLHVHLRWHSVCLEACVAVSEIRAMLQTQQKRRIGSDMGSKASSRVDVATRMARRSYLDQARMRRAAHHAAVILASAFALPSQQLMHLHISQSVCSSTALLLAIALEESAERQASTSINGTNDAMTPAPVDAATAAELWHVAQIETDRIVGDAGWAVAAAVGTNSHRSGSSTERKAQREQGEGGGGAAAGAIREWICTGNERIAPFLSGTPLVPGEALRNKLKSVVYDVRSLQRPLPSHLAPWLDLFLAVVA